MEYVKYAIVPLSVAIITPLIYAIMQKSNARKESKMSLNDFIIGVSTKLCGIFVFAIVIFAIILILLNMIERINIIQNAICIPFLIFFAFGCLVLIREKIIIKDNTIKCIPGIGKKKEYKFEEIKFVKETNTRGMKILAVFGDGKMFNVSNLSVGYNLQIGRAHV